MERLIKKLSMTCRSHLDEEEDKKKQKELQEKLNGKVSVAEPAPKGSTVFVVPHPWSDSSMVFQLGCSRQRAYTWGSFWVIFKG